MAAETLLAGYTRKAEAIITKARKGKGTGGLAFAYFTSDAEASLVAMIIRQAAPELDTWMSDMTILTTGGRVRMTAVNAWLRPPWAAK